MLDILSGGRARARMPRSLILEPTRELALQVAENFVEYGKYLKLTHALLIGGESMSDQKDAADARRRRADRHARAAARPVRARRLLLTDCRLLVIDEADRMLDMGFIPDVERIVSMLPANRQTLFFSRHHGAGDPSPGRRLPAQSDGDHGQQAGLGRHDHHRRPGAGGRARQARGAAPADPHRGRAERADLLQPQARRRHPLQVADQAWLQRRRAAWRHGAAGAVRDAGEVQGRTS